VREGCQKGWVEGLGELHEMHLTGRERGRERDHTEDGQTYRQTDCESERRLIRLAAVQWCVR
jgi:hypothetical protein